MPGRMPHVFRAGFETSPKGLPGRRRDEVLPKVEKGTVQSVLLLLRRRIRSESLDTPAALVSSEPYDPWLHPKWQRVASGPAQPSQRSSLPRMAMAAF
jgi:hypothetical protein